MDGAAQGTSAQPLAVGAGTHARDICFGGILQLGEPVTARQWDRGLRIAIASPDQSSRGRLIFLVTNVFCRDWLLRGRLRTFSPSHRGIVTTYALEVGAAGDSDNRNH